MNSLLRSLDADTGAAAKLHADGMPEAAAAAMAIAADNCTSERAIQYAKAANRLRGEGMPEAADAAVAIAIECERRKLDLKNIPE